MQVDSRDHPCPRAHSGPELHRKLEHMSSSTRGVAMQALPWGARYHNRDAHLYQSACWPQKGTRSLAPTLWAQEFEDPLHWGVEFWGPAKYLPHR